MPLSTDSVFVIDPIKDPNQLTTKSYVDSLFKKMNQPVQPTKTIIKKEVVIVDNYIQGIMRQAMKDREVQKDHKPLSKGYRDTDPFNRFHYGW